MLKWALLIGGGFVLYEMLSHKSPVGHLPNRHIPNVQQSYVNPNPNPSLYQNPNSIIHGIAPYPIDPNRYHMMTGWQSRIVNGMAG